MLGIEKISKEKLIYFIVISIVISGVVFFIYQILDSMKETKIGFTFFEGINIKTYKAIKPLDISVLNSSEFKALKEIIVREMEIEVGRDNPFENPFNLSNK